MQLTLTNILLIRGMESKGNKTCTWLTTPWRQQQRTWK